MNSRDWLRAMVLRDRRKAKATWTAMPTREAVHLTIDNSDARYTMPSGYITTGRELSEGDVEQIRARFRQAVAPVRTREPLPNHGGCTCESAIYSECHCAARGEAGQP